MLIHAQWLASIFQDEAGGSGPASPQVIFPGRPRGLGRREGRQPLRPRCGEPHRPMTSAWVVCSPPWASHSVWCVRCCRNGSRSAGMSNPSASWRRASSSTTGKARLGLEEVILDRRRRPAGLQRHLPGVQVGWSPRPSRDATKPLLAGPIPGMPAASPRHSSIPCPGSVAARDQPGHLGRLGADRRGGAERLAQVVILAEPPQLGRRVLHRRRVHHALFGIVQVVLAVRREQPIRERPLRPDLALALVVRPILPQLVGVHALALDGRAGDGEGLGDISRAEAFPARLVGHVLHHVAAEVQDVGAGRPWGPRPPHPRGRQGKAGLAIRAAPLATAPTGAISRPRRRPAGPGWRWPRGARCAGPSAGPARRARSTAPARARPSWSHPAHPA